MLALVAMLSFTFSAFAQTTVTTEAELKTAMSSANSIVLDADITLQETVVIPKKIAVTLDLNGHRIEGVTTGQNGISLQGNASLTINDSKGTGVITAKSYVLNGAGGSKIILNAGKIYRSSWAVYTTGSFVINGGTVECNDGSMAIRVAGSGTVTLNAGTVTSVQVSGGTLNVQDDDATITSGIQLDKGAKDVNITAGTINGDITVADEAKDKITVSGGTFEDGDAVKDYLEDGKIVTEDGQVVAGMFQIGDAYYPTLAEAVTAAQPGQTIVLLKDTDEAYVLPVGVKFDNNGFNAPNIKVAVAKVGEVGYSDIQEAIKAAAPAGIVDVLADVTVDKWVMFAEKMTIGDGSLITLNINGLTINGNNKIMTVKSIESAGNGGYLFYDAQNLTVKDWTINIADGLVGGIGLQQGTISNVTFNGGQYGVLPGKNGVTVSGCTFNDTKGYAVYYEDARPGIVVTGNTFNTADGKYAITMRSNEQFTNNTITKGRVNLANSAASTVSGNDFGTERFKVYNGATATISNNKINNLVFNETTAPAASTFTADNTLSAEAQAAIEALPVMAGDGTEANPYTIGNLTQLKEFRDEVNAGNNYQGKFVKLTADIDLNNEEWTPIATFNGVFNGNDKTISNLVVNGAGKSNQGFFGQTNNGEIKNLTINNAKVTGRLNVGVVAGTPYTSKYTNIKVTGHVEVNGMAYVGGVGGKNAYANWTDITVDVNNDSYVKATSTENGTAYRTYVGGIIGFNGEGGHTFKNISSNIKVIGDVMDVGGIFGILHYGNKAENVTFTGAVEAPAGAKEVGGIAGVWHNEKGTAVTITNATSEGTVKVGDVTTTGSIVGGAYNAANQSPETSGSLKVDGKEVWVGLAKVGEVPYETLAAAVAAAQANETVTLLGDITASDIIKITKSITIDGNGKKLTYTGTDRAIDVPNDANANIDVTVKNLTVVATTANRGLNYNENGKFNVEGVTVTIGENVDGYAINFPGMADNAQVTIKNSKLTSRNPLNIWGENMVINVYDSEIISVDNNSTYDYAAIQLNNEIPTVGPNGAIANGTFVNVYGGTITALNDKGEPSNVVANATETGVVNISDETVVTGKVLDYVANIGGVYFGSLQAAVDAIEKHGYNSPIVIMKSFATSETATVKNGLNVTIDLNGKTITGTDNTSKNFSIIDNRGTLTIKDSSADKTGKITLTATTNSGWNRYSAVIANNPGGKLTVESGTIEHLGGTDMAYGIDNLTNGKGTYAETIINGGTIKSTYRGIRQFLNGTEAQNILTINGGTIEGANKSVWMQDPNKNANTGTLTVAKDAKLTGDVYLFVTAGSTEWPVEVSIAAAALQGESKVATGNVPAGYDFAEVNGTYGVFSGAAKIGTTYYETVTAAINAAADGATVQLLSGTIDEYIAPWAGDTQHKTEKSITIVGAENFGTTLTGGLYLGYDDSQCRDHNIVVKGIAFEGKGVLVASQKNVTIEGNKFSNITDCVASPSTASKNAISINGKDVNAVVKNNIITTTASVGIDLRNIKTAEVEGNTVANTQHNSMQVQNASAESKVEVLNNNFSDWGLGGEGRAMRINVAKDVTVNGNVMSHTGTVPEEFAKVTGATALDASKNYWNGLSPLAAGMFAGVEGDPANVLLSYYTDVDKTELVTFSASVATIGNVYYQTLAEAVEAAANGDVVTLISDVTMDAKQYVTQNDGYAVLVNAKDKNVTVDLNGKTVAVDVEAVDLDGAAGKMLLAVFHADLNGALTLVDNSADKAGKVIVNANEDAKVYSLGASESCVSDKSQNGTLTINGGTYIINKVKDSMFFTDADGKIVINGGTFELGNIATGANGSPWIFNTYGQNGRQVIVNGGTFNADVNHQFWANEVFVPGTKALKDNGDGTWTTVDAVAYTEELATSTYAYSRMIGYATVEEAMAATGKYNCIDNAVALVKDVEVESSIVVAEGVEAVLDLNGKVLSMNDASGATAALIKNNGILTIDDRSEAKSGKISFKSTIPSAANAYASNAISNYGTITVKAGVIENLTVGGACYALDNYAGSTATIEGGKLTAEKTAVRIFNWTNGEATKATLNVNGGEIYSKDGYAINVNSGNAPSVALNITGGTITTDDTDYNLAVYVINKGTAESFTANVTGGVFNGNFALNGVTATTMKENAVSISGGRFEGVICYETPAYGFVSGGTFANNVDEYCAAGYICKANEDGTYGVVVNPEYGKIAQIGNGSVFANQYFATLNDAAQAAETGDVIKLIADVNITAAGYATIDETNQYSTMMAVKEKDITLDMNGKTITVTPTADELADAEMQMLMSVFGMDTNGKLTITGNGTVKVVANNANVYSIVTAYGEGSQVTIENGNFEADKLMLSGSLFYSQQSECIYVKGGNFSLGNLADPEGQNGQPWVFNTKGQNYTGAIVNGGTFPTDINHQFWAHEVRVPETKALKLNAEGRWDVVDAVAYTTEKASSRGSYYRNIGYASIEDAIAATGNYNCKDNTVTMVKDIAIETEVKIANGTTIVLDLNGKTIAGTDKGTASFGLITNRGDLTIQDSSEEAAGKITLTATQNRGWNAYSSVISNQVGGKLTVEGGTLEHLGGTSMAWGIDNLTNGKGTYAETIINGGVVKSAYIAIRQFLNGVEADNILTVNGGTLEGETASLYFQDPSKNANTGTLNVLDGTLAGDVYLDVTAGSTEWPVEVYITKAALGEYEIHTENIPEDAAALVEYAEFWQVEQKNLAELTIVDEDYAEYINKVEKTVGMLTYERTFENAEWQTLYLPFEVPVANLMNDFDVAYIYNAGYKNSTATLDYVVIEDANFVLAANYPYLIRAKETGQKSIVVENAKLMPTEINTIDCSSVFEKFVFAGNYSTLDASTLDAKKGYFDMNAGNWSRMDVLNPFRVYMQIELRNGNGSDFVYPTESQKIRMRRVDENGEASGIDEVDAEHGVDYIFDLHGRRVAEPQKGQLYIINGKKVVF